MIKATIKTNKGDMKFNLLSDAAPKAVENFVKQEAEKARLKER